MPDEDSLQDAWCVDDGAHRDDGVSFSPRLSLVFYEEDEPTWSQPVGFSSPRGRTTRDGRRSRDRSHHELVSPHVTLAMNRDMSSTDCGFSNVRS